MKPEKGELGFSGKSGFFEECRIDMDRECYIQHEGKIRKNLNMRKTRLYKSLLPSRNLWKVWLILLLISVFLLCLTRPETELN